LFLTHLMLSAVLAVYVARFRMREIVTVSVVSKRSIIDLCSGLQVSRRAWKEDNVMAAVSFSNQFSSTE